MDQVPVYVIMTARRLFRAGVYTPGTSQADADLSFMSQRIGTGSAAPTRRPSCSWYTLRVDTVPGRYLRAMGGAPELLCGDRYCRSYNATSAPIARSSPDGGMSLR